MKSFCWIDLNLRQFFVSLVATSGITESALAWLRKLSLSWHRWLWPHYCLQIFVLVEFFYWAFFRRSMQSGFATSATMGKASHRSSLNRSLDPNRKPKDQDQHPRKWEINANGGVRCHTSQVLEEQEKPTSEDVEVEFRVAIIHTPQCNAGLFLPSNIKVPLRQIWQTYISAPPKTLNLKNTYFVVVGGGGRVFYIQFQS